MYPGQRGLCNPLLQDFHRIGLNDAHVGQCIVLDVAQQTAHARRIDLDAQKVGVGARGRNRCSGVTHAEADLEHHRRLACEEGTEIDRAIARRHAVLRQQPFMGIALGVREMAAPHHEAADMAMNGLVLDRHDGRYRLIVRNAHRYADCLTSGRWGRSELAQVDPMMPPVGDDGLAL